MSEDAPRYVTPNYAQLRTGASVPDRPSRPIEHACNSSENLADMAESLARRLHSVLERIHQGPKPNPLEKDVVRSLVEPAMGELLRLEQNLSRIERNLHSIVDATNHFEDL